MVQDGGKAGWGVGFEATTENYIEDLIIVSGGKRHAFSTWFDVRIAMAKRKSARQDVTIRYKRLPSFNINP
jgi:hypothetical protein